MDWKEKWIDKMGLIVALSGKERFRLLDKFKREMNLLSDIEKIELKHCIRLRFTPSCTKDNFQGCYSATNSVENIINS